MALSVVVVSYNTRHLLDEMMSALDASTEGISKQVVIVDNASRDGSARYIRDSWPHVELISNEINVGFGRANNQALPLLRGANVLLLNTDAFVSRESVRTALREFERYPRCGIVGMRLVGRDGITQPSCRYFPTPWNVFLGTTGLARFSPRTQLIDDPAWKAEMPAECDWVPGAFLLCRREVIEEVGLFDPRYFLYYEEVDFCRAVKQAGWSVRYCPFADVVHVGGESAKSDGQLSGSGRQLTSLQVESALLYFRKHHGLNGLIGNVFLTAVSDMLVFVNRIFRGRVLAGSFGSTGLVLRMLVATRLAKRPTR